MRNLSILLLVCVIGVGLGSLTVPKCPTMTDSIQFYNTVTGTPEDKSPPTSAWLCHSGGWLMVGWECPDDSIISTLKGCNAALYQQDAVELFLATSMAEPNQYFEFQISPKGELFFAEIANPNKNCTGMSTAYYPCSLVDYSASINAQKTQWGAQLGIPLSVIGLPSGQNTLYANLFRIDKSATEPTRYLAWKPTLANPACFHIPQKFETLILA